MLNGIFGKWLREFATLVLTQTVQAFLLAIVMTIIISCLGSSNSTDANTKNQAAGLLCIIALASFGKIEMLVKNIFGVTSQFGDPSLNAGARGLTAGGLLAMRGGKRLLDNGTKLVDSQRKINEAKKGLASLNDGVTNNELNSFGERVSDTSAEDGGALPNVDGDGNPVAGMANAAADMAETSVKIQGLDNLTALNTAINQLTDATKKANGGSDRQKYEAMLKEGKDMRRSAVRENVGAFIGGTTGAIVGLAKGEDIIQTTLAGAGAGDALGQATANRKAQKLDFNKRNDELNQKIKDLTDAQYENNIKALEKSLESNGMGSISNKKDFAIKNAPVGSNSISSQSRKVNKAVNSSVNDARRNERIEKPQNLNPHTRNE